MTSETTTTTGDGGATRELVERLVADLRPVRPVRLARVFGWFLLGEVCAAAAVAWMMGLRPDIGQRLAEPAFVAMLAALALAGAGCAAAAVHAALPGRYVRRSAEFWLLASPLLLAALVLLVRPWPEHWQGWRVFLTGCWKCTAATAASAALPWLVAVVVLRRLAPLIALRVALFAGFSAFLIGALVTQLHCPMVSNMHLAFAHLLPVMLLSAAACGITAALLKRS